MNDKSPFLSRDGLLVLSLVVPLRVFGADRDDLLRIYGSEEMISLATGYEQTVSDAPATATVITAEDIQRLGARTLDEVLRTVPGLHITTPRALAATPIIRGIITETGGNVLVLINGIRIESAFTGSGSTFKDILVETIARVEVIRGPGSALYGADAFAGVINIVTKTADDIDGRVVGGRAGSFDTYDGWALYGDQWGEVAMAVMAVARTTDGDNPRIDADAQSFLDQQFGTQASLAPGPVNTNLDNGELRLDLGWRSLTLRANYERKKQGTGTGFINALDPKGKFENERLAAELEYRDNVSDTLALRALASFRQQKQNPQLTLLPSGTGGIDLISAN